MLLCSVVTAVPLVWCFSRSRLGVPGKSEGTIFTPVQCQIGYYEPERVAGVCKGRGWEGGWGAVCVLCVCVCVCVCTRTHTHRHTYVSSSQPPSHIMLMLYVLL